MASEEAPVLTEIRPPIGLLSLNRPARLNAVSLSLYEALAEQLDRLECDDAIRVIVITGTGRAFCVGADLQAHARSPSDAEARRRYVRAAQEASTRIQEIAKPVVAAVNGHAIGAGLELALACDILVVAAEAKFRFPEIGLGTFLGGGVTYTLPDRVGLTRARELLLLCPMFSGTEAAEMHLVQRAVPAPQVLPLALDIAAELAAKAPLSLAFAKALVGRLGGTERKAALAAEADALLKCMESEDWREGIRAFHEKREPRFIGE